MPISTAAQLREIQPARQTVTDRQTAPRKISVGAGQARARSADVTIGYVGSSGTLEQVTMDSRGGSSGHFCLASKRQPLQRFAREHQIGVHRLRWWVQRLKIATPLTAVGDGQDHTNEPIAFVPAMVMGRVHEAAVVVRLPDGIEVEFRDAARVDVEELGRLVNALRKDGR